MKVKEIGGSNDNIVYLWKLGEPDYATMQNKTKSLIDTIASYSALCESSSTQSEMPLLSLHSVAKVAAMWRWVKKSVSENLKSLGAVKSVETANLSFSQILRIC